MSECQCHCRVRIGELTWAAGLHPLATVEQLGIESEVGPDWAGHPSVSLEFARRFVERARADRLKREAGQAAYRLYLEGRGQEREMYARKASESTRTSAIQRARRSLHAATVGGGLAERSHAEEMASREVRETYIDALARFDEKHAALGFDEWLRSDGKAHR